MTKRFAAAMSLIVFAVCLFVGMQTTNSIGTTIERAMLAMAGTLVIGLIIGAMAQKMLDENVKTQEQKDQKTSTETQAGDR